MVVSRKKFEVECRARVGQLRTALVELYESIGANPQKPQDVARTLRINTTLAWHVARLLQAADELAAVSHVPGTASLEKVILASQKQGAPTIAVNKARAAVRDFDAMIRDHAGDRPTLDLIVDGAGPANNGALELSRKLMFRGSSGLYGVQARTKVVTNFLAPTPGNSQRLDVVHVGGYIDFRHLRPGVRWPIFMMRAWGTSNVRGGELPVEPVEPSDQAVAGFPVISSFVRGNMPKIIPVVAPEGRHFILEAGPVGNEGAFDCFWGDILRGAVHRYLTAEDQTGEFSTAITAPSENLVMDILVDQDLEFALNPQLLVFGHNFAQGRPTGSADDPSLLPIQNPAGPLPGSPPLVNTPLVPNYARLVSQVYERMNWNPRRFRGVRLTLAYPPLGSSVVLRFQLPPRKTRDGGTT